MSDINYMEDAWTVMSMDECIHGVYESKEAAELAIANTVFNFGLEAVPIKVNRTPEDQRTQELREELEEAWLSSGTTKIHLSKGIKFYESTTNERYQLLIDMIKGQGVFDPKNMREIDLTDGDIKRSNFDETFNQTDVRDSIKRKTEDG